MVKGFSSCSFSTNGRNEKCKKIVDFKIIAKYRHRKNYTQPHQAICHVDDPYPHLLRKITNMFTAVTSALFPVWRELYRSIVNVLYQPGIIL
jgi:hypothetical protein